MKQKFLDNEIFTTINGYKGEKNEQTRFQI